MLEISRKQPCCSKPAVGHDDINTSAKSPHTTTIDHLQLIKLPLLPSTPPSDPTPIRKGLGIAKGALFIADGLPRAFPPLEAAVDILHKAVDIIEQYLDNEDGLKGIQGRIGQIDQDLQRFRRPDGTALPGQPQPEDQPRIFLENALKNVFESLERTKSSDLAKEAVMGESIATKIQTYLDEVEQALDRYHFSLTQDVRNTQLGQDDVYRLDKLHTATAPDAVSRGELPGCLKGTRTSILEELRQWASDRNSPQVFWLNGYAGTGKSTIAQTFAELLSSQGELGASFLCSRTLRDRDSAEKILPTLSYQLCTTSKVFRTALLKELKANESIATSASLSVQLEHLLIIPAGQLVTPTVMLIDALDECADKQSLSILLSQLIREIARAPSLKLFITSRASQADLHIKRSLLPTSPPTVISGMNIKVREMHTVDGVDNDVRLFIDTEFGRTASERLDVAIPPGWPEKEKTDLLVSRARGLFIFASTAVKAIKSTGYDPVKRLDHLTETTTDGRRPSPSGERALQQYNHYTELDKLYLNILKDAFPTKKKSELSHVRSILGLLAVTYEPLTLTTIAAILPFLTINKIYATLELLHPVVLVPRKREEVVRFRHRSFLDFLSDRRRCKDLRFYIDMNEHHLNVARFCFDVMDRQYRVKPKNICNLPRYTRNNELSLSFVNRDKRRVSHSIKYSCRHWADHLLADRNRDEHFTAIASLLTSFVKTKQLWWFEVLSLIEELQVAIKTLDRVHVWLSSLNSSNSQSQNRIGKRGQLELIRWTDESKKFASFAFDAIQDSAAHIYHSALPFSAINSTHRRFADRLANTEAKLVIGADEHWTDPGAGPTRIPSIQSTAPITFAHFSLDGRFIVSGSEDKTLRIWSASESGNTPPGILLVLRHPSVFLGGTFLPNDTYVVCYAEDGSLVLCQRDGEQANICDQDTTAHNVHGQFGQLFPAGAHKPFGFFSSHKGEQYRWKLCYWEVMQEIPNNISTSRRARSNKSTKSPTRKNARLRLLAQGTLRHTGGYGLTRVHHHPCTNTTMSTIIAEFRDNQQFVASMKDLSIPIADKTDVVPQTLTFRKDTDRVIEPTEAEDSYIGLEKPCLQSDDGTWVLDEQGRRVLWVPPMHRGSRGRWWGKKLLLEGSTGRITLLDFSRVDPHGSDLF